MVGIIRGGGKRRGGIGGGGDCIRYKKFKVIFKSPTRASGVL